jgi:hypothetical protein
VTVGRPANLAGVAEGLSTAEVSKEIAEHHAHATHAHAGRDRVISIIEAVLLSVVALLAAWSGYSAAKWSSHASILLAEASATRTKSNLDEIEANQIRTLDSVSFNAAESAYLSHNTKLFELTLKRMRPGYRPAVQAWLALHPLKNPNAPPDPSYMPQYKIPQEATGRALSARADALFAQGEAATATGDKYVRLTVLFAAVLFLVGIGSRFPVHAARTALLGIATVILVISIVELLGLPGPPA